MPVAMANDNARSLNRHLNPWQFALRRVWPPYPVEPAGWLWAMTQAPVITLHCGVHADSIENALPAPGTVAALELAGPVGRLQALLATPRGAPRGVAVICHPHPLYGGTMTNKVVHALASCALKSGLCALRFNFRGVDGSAGRYDSARGETDDTLAAVAWLRTGFPGLPLLLAGFSFGAYIALKAAAQARPAWLVSVSLPLGRVRGAFGEQGNEPLPAHPGCPWLAVHSRDDEVVDYAETQRLLAGYQPPPRLETLEGAGHFYHGRLGDLQRVVLEFLQTQGST